MYIQAGLSVDDPDFPPPPGVKRVEVCVLIAHCFVFMSYKLLLMLQKGTTRIRLGHGTLSRTCIIQDTGYLCCKCKSINMTVHYHQELMYCT